MRVPLLILIVALSVPASAPAADLAVRHARTHHRLVRHLGPIPGHYPLSRRAAAVHAGESCWRACEHAAAQAFLFCMRQRPLTPCVAGNDAADRYCLRSCRLSGGPLVDLAD